MATGIETEIKLTLHSENIPEKLRAITGPAVTRVEQLNRYFRSSSPGETMVRIREESGGLVLTVKGPTTTTERGVFSRTESNEAIPPEWLFQLQAGEIPEGLMSLEAMAGVEGPLLYLGSLRNTRWLFQHQGLNLEVDRTEFPDGDRVDWEVEVETESPVEAAPILDAILTIAGIEATPSRQSKFQKFLDSVGQTETVT